MGSIQIFGMSVIFFFQSVLEVKNQQHASSSSSPSSAPFSFPTSVTPSHFALPHSGIDGQCVMCINVCVTRRDEWPHARPSLVETKLSTFRVHKLLIGLSVYPSNGDISVSLSLSLSQLFWPIDGLATSKYCCFSFAIRRQTAEPRPFLSYFTAPYFTVGWELEELPSRVEMLNLMVKALYFFLPSWFSRES